MQIKTVELPDQVTVPYVDRGDPQGIPVLLIHAVADSWRALELLMVELPDSIRAIALTQRGHGDASRPESGYCPEDFAADIVAFMDALQLEACVMVGASSGGFVIRHVALIAPSRVLALVFLGSPATLRDKPVVRELWESTLSKLTDPIDRRFVRDFLESTLVRPVPRAFLETMEQESLKVPARVWRATMEGLVNDDSLRELHAINVPTLIVWGDEDRIIPRSDQETLAEAIPGSRLMVHAGGGHAFYWEDPVLTASDLVAFIKDVIS